MNVSDEVYVRPFPGRDGTMGRFNRRWRFSDVVRTAAVLSWPPRRTHHGGLVPVEQRSFRSEKPRVWSEGRFMQRRSNRGAAGQVNNFDLHPGGDRVALAPLPQQEPARQDKIVFIFNFFEELRRLAPGSKPTPF